ncbi:MAG TPA: carbonic anhydrase [Candidatus Saccharimonadales bacterium]|nr:carbonic anhydrase [Candidatus Saccharimonadales bacterium]
MSGIRPRGINKNVDNLVITCIDHRFQRVIAKLLKDEHRVDIEASDRIAYAGASKAVADGTLISNIQISYRLHNIKNIWLIDHTDCGGFGGLKAYEDDEQKEVQAHFDSFSQATEAIKNVLPQLKVNVFVVSLDGESIKPS